MSIINRQRYIDKVKPFINKDLIKVFVGQRRVGKSYLMKLTEQYILEQNPDANIIFIDKERYEFDHISDYHSLIAFVNNKIVSGKSNYLFIDEIQEISGFEKGLRHFQNSSDIDIYCTGSSGDILSGELASLLSGRHIKIDVFSLCYSEFLTFHNLDDSREALQNFLKWGGLPYLMNLDKNDEVVYDYLSNILSSIIYKDIIHRYNIRNVEFFDRLIRFIASNTGNLISAKKISDYLKSQKVNIAPRVVLNYLNFLQKAFLIYKSNRIDIHSKKVFEINDKYYFEDWGLRNALLGINEFSVPDIIENVVFSHLKYLNYTVRVGVLNNYEIDFVAENNKGLIYVQVAYLIADEKVKQREFGNLLMIKDNYPKYVISLDSFPISSYKGIIHLNLRDFLKLEEL